MTVSWRPKEIEIADLLTDGLSNELIAAKTGLTIGTVRNYLHVMYQKSGMSDRLEFTLWYIHHFKLKGE